MPTARPTAAFFSALTLVLVIGCDDAPSTSSPGGGKGDAPPPKNQPETKPKAEPEAPAKAEATPPVAAPIAKGMTKLDFPALSLHAVAPQGATASPATVEGGTLVHASEFVAIVLPAADPRPTTAEAAAKHRALRSRRDVKTETLEDGWVVTFREANDWGPVYFAQVRREIAGTPIWCESATGGPRMQAKTVEFCSSLAP